MRIGDRSLASVLRPWRFLGSHQLKNLSAKYSLYATGVFEDETFSTQTVPVYFSYVFCFFFYRLNIHCTFSGLFSVVVFPV